MLLERRLGGVGVGAQERDELGGQLRRIRARAQCLAAAGWAPEPGLVAARGPVRTEGAGTGRPVIAVNPWANWPARLFAASAGTSPGGGL